MAVTKFDIGLSSVEAFSCISREKTLTIMPLHFFIAILIWIPYNILQNTLRQKQTSGNGGAQRYEYRCFQNEFLEKERMMKRVILISLCSSLLGSCASGGKHGDATNAGMLEAEERTHKGESQGKFENIQKEWSHVYRDEEKDAGRLKILLIIPKSVYPLAFFQVSQMGR